MLVVPVTIVETSGKVFVTIREGDLLITSTIAPAVLSSWKRVEVAALKVRVFAL